MSMTCQNCHRPLPPGSSFCENCGARVSPPGGGSRPQNNRNRRPNRRRGGGANPAVIIIIIVLALALVTGIVIGIVVLVKKGGKGGGETGRGQVLHAGEVYEAGDIALSMEDALFWTKGEAFLSPGFKYAQIWLHMENTSDKPVAAPPDSSFYMYYPDKQPQWMKDWQTTYGKDILKKTFGAENRANIIGDVTEGEASFDDEYYDDPITIQPGETATVYLLYQVPEDTTHVSVLYFATEELAKKGKEPNAVFELDVAAERESQPDDKVWTYDDPAAAAAEKSTYKRPDMGDLAQWMSNYEDENELRDSFERNGKYIMQPEALNGGWIVQIHCTGMERERYLNGELQITPDGAATLTLDWYQLYDVWEKTYKDETDLPNTVYRGTWNQSGSMSVSDGSDTIRIVAFSQWDNGLQVGEGYYEPGDKALETPWMIYLVRPGRFATDFMTEEVLAELDSKICYSDLDPQHRNTEPLAEGETLAETTEPIETTEPSETTEAPTEDTTAATQPVTDPATNQQDGGNNPGDGGDFNGDGFPSISTFEKPTIDELMWVANAKDAGAPPGATYIDFGKACTGAWKCRLYYDESTTQLTNVVISDIDGEISVNIVWYLLWYNGEAPINEEDTENSIFTGYEWGNGIKTTGPGNFEIDYFYQIGEYQYAVGTFTAPSGETATVGMIRP